MTLDETVAQLQRGFREFDREAEIAEKIQALNARDPHLRSAAARRLGELRAGSEALLERLVDVNGIVRTAAAEALGSSAAEENPEMRGEVIEALLAAIDDSNDYVCSAAIRSLGRLKAQEAQQELFDCLGDGNQHIVQAAIQALAQIGPAEIASQLAKYLDAENIYTCVAAVNAMGVLGFSQAAPRLLEILENSLHSKDAWHNRSLQSALIESLARLQVTECVPLLVEMARNEVGLRSRAIHALIDLGAEQVAPLLADLLLDPGTSLRSSLLELVGRAVYRPALPLVRPLLNDNNGHVRRSALETITQLQDITSIPAVREIVQHDPNPYIRVHAVHSLATLAETKVLPDLLALFKDTNAYVRQAAVECCGNQDALPEVIVQGLRDLGENDPAPSVRSAAQQALEQHQNRPRLPDEVVQSSPTASLLPPEFTSERMLLRAALERWQAWLPELARSSSLQDLQTLDTAISRLLDALEATGEQG